ncbi:mitogen-activated protein kinase kinase kinase [Rhodotorula kratochvilovae]
MQAPADRYRSPPPPPPPLRHPASLSPSSPPRPSPASFHPAVRPLPTPQQQSPPQPSPSSSSRPFSPASPPASGFYAPFSPQGGPPPWSAGGQSGFRPQPPPPSADDRWRSASGSSVRWHEPQGVTSPGGAYDPRGGSGFRREGSTHSSPLPPGALCTATSDLESLVVVPLGAVSSVHAIKDLVLSRLHIPDEDAPRHAFHLTRIGAGEGRPASDAELWDAVRRSAQGDGPQVTVFVKEVVPRREGGSPETGRSAAEYAGGATARRERERERERDMSGARRGTSPAAASSSSARHRSPSLVGELDEFGARAADGLRSDHPRSPSGSGGSVGHGSRQASASSDGSRIVTSPQSFGQFSPPVPTSGGSGFRSASGSSLPQKTSPEDYFYLPPPPPLPPQARSPQSSPNPGSYPPHLRAPTYPQPPQPPQVVMGPSGPTRRLPPQPHSQDHQQQQQRAQTTPAIAVTSPGWTRSAPVPAPQQQQQQTTTVPPPRPVVSPHAHAPPPPSSSSAAGRVADPRANLPQYGSQPYRNLPLPAGQQSPYHNLSLQNQFHSVEYMSSAALSAGAAAGAGARGPPPSLPPRAATLAVQGAGRMASKSADNLRLVAEHAHAQAQGTYTPPPSQASAGAPSGFRPPAAPTGHPGAAGSRPAQSAPALPLQPHPQQLGSVSLVHPAPSPVPSPASAFYSAPVQAQHAAAAAAAASRGAPPVPRRPGLEQSRSQPVPGPGARPATMYDLPAVANGAGEGWREGVRPRSETLDYAVAPPSAPQASAPPFEDDDGAYDGLARSPVPASGGGGAGRSASPPSSASGPVTPASDAPAPPRPRLVDEFGDPLDEETSTWFPVGQQQAVVLPLVKPLPPPVAPKAPQQATPRLLDEFGDPLDEETSTWFPVNQASSPMPPPPPPLQQQPASKPRLVDEFGDALDEETNTWFPVNQPALSLVRPTAPTAPTPPPASAPASVVAVPTTAVPAPSSYGSSSSPMRRQTSAPGSSAGGGAAGGSAGGSNGPSPVSSGAGPASGGSASSERRDSVPNAQDWTQTILSRFGAGAGAPPAGEEGTLLAGGGTGTLRPAPSAPPAASVPATPKLVDEFGDELEDASTFFPGHGPGVPSPLGRASSLGSRPSLRLKIDGPTPPSAAGTPAPSRTPQPFQGGPNPSTPGAAHRRSASSSAENEASSFAGALERLSLAGRSGTPSDGNGSGRRTKAAAAHPRLDELVRMPGSPFARRNSFAAREHDQDWAFRPPVETVLEHLDVFFPEHDLDKPVFDLPTPGTPGSNPSTSASSPVRDAPPPSAPSTLASRRAAHLGYRKSIRVVAQDRKRMLQKAGNNVARAASGLASNLLRRKSTKLFGARIEEVTSAQMKQIGAIKETSDEDPENFSYKWIKGDLIGRGTYGHVYIALSVTTGETIAVKQVEMPRSFSDKEDQRTKGMISSLKAEIELLKDLDHPNIVLYLGMEQTPEFLSIFLEYVPGGSIGRIIRTHGKFEENVIKFFTLQILDGLEYLHSLGILHRDMKADNILIDQDGMCKISDFGTSKKSGDIYQNNENMSMQGSIFWMAPEVIHNNKQGYSAKADIWSLGCICIEMLAGSRPWEGEGFMSAMFKLGAERMRPPLPPDVQLSEFAEQFVSACLQIEPDMRPTAADAKRDPFLTSLDPTWSFTQTSLYRIMAADEESRAHKPSTPSALGA